MEPEVQPSPESEATLLADANEAIAKANGTAVMREEEVVLEAEDSGLVPTDEPVDKGAKVSETIQDIPIWFTRHCVKTVAEIRADATPIIARDRKHEPAQPPSQHPSGDLQVEGDDSYLVDSTILESITRFRTVGENLDEDVETFRHDAVHIRFPADSRTHGGSHFLEALIQWFAISAQATLVTLDKNDLLDLAAHFGAGGPHEAEVPGQGRDSSQDSDSNDEGGSNHDSDSEDDPPKRPDCEDANKGLPYHALFAAAKLKTSTADPETSTPDRTLGKIGVPLVIHLINAHDYLEEDAKVLLRGINEEGGNPCRQVIVFTTTERALDGFDTAGCSCWDCKHTDRDATAAELSRLTGRRPYLHTTYAAPVRNAAQERMFKLRESQQESHEIRNVRAIKQAIRESNKDLWEQCPPVQSIPEILQPYADWAFLAKALMYERIVNAALSKAQLAELVRDVVNPQDSESIKSAILQTGFQTQALEEWSKSKDESTDDETDSLQSDAESIIGRWRGFSKEIRARLEKIAVKADQHEEALLESIVTPSDVGDTWADIAIDEKNQKHIMQVVSQKSDPTAYGLLKDQRLGGALLYGPPGTGKTHLARVLAKESGALMISISYAEIEDKWVGETEKTIKALFKLGRRLAPSIIFIDEADSLLSARSSDDREWTRSRKSQFLSEMDGLRRFKNPPFVMLATNFPTLLDSAIIRRVPSRVFIGLPTHDLRRNILKIILRDEDIDPMVDFDILAQQTRGFSGSDIRTFCIQTAHISRSRQDKDRRLLTTQDFREALDRCGPSVSRKAMDDIRKFATDYDPRALEQFAQLERESAGLRSNPQPPIVPEQNTSQSFNLSYPYEAIPAEGTHIRVLSFESQGSEFSEAHATPLLSLRMHTVDIDDWTEEWTMMESILPDHTNCQLLAAWLAFQNFTDDPGSFLGSEELAAVLKAPTSDSFHIPIECTTCMVPRFRWGDFLALSYVWGDSNLREEILLNGQRFSITASLHQTLTSLAACLGPTDSHLFFWADGICINQNDLAERALEVRKMTEIYTRCLSCRTYLGPSTPELAEYFPALKMNLFERIESMVKGATNSAKIDFHWIDEDERFIEIANSLLAAALWRRVWTLQESVLPPFILYMYGQDTIEPAMLMSLTHIMAYRDIHSTVEFMTTGLYAGDEPSSRVSRSRGGGLRLAARWKSKYPQSPNDLHIFGGIDARRSNYMSVSETMAHARASRATDPRDKVYGILALLPTDLARHVIPSYETSNTYEKTIQSFTLTCFDEMGNLDLLAATDNYKAPTAATVSWLPDLQSPVDEFEIGNLQTANDIASIAYRANLNINCSLAKPSVQDLVLTCEGAFIGRVACIQSAGNHLFTAQPGKVGLNDVTETLESHNDWSWKLSIVQVFLGDPNYKFTSSLSIFDMPWMRQEDFLADPDLAYKPWREDVLQGTNISWKNIYMTYGPCFQFMNKIRGYANLLVGGKPLASYFTSQDEFCSSQEALGELALLLVSQMKLSRPLFTTVDGRLGACSESTQVDDHIIILADCCTPLIVREFGEHYKIVSPCYIDGFMNGELADGIAKGEYQLEQVSFT